MAKDALIVFHVVPTVYLTSAEVRALSADDDALLGELGASAAMLAQLRVCARVDGRRMRLDFDAKSVTIEGAAGPRNGAAARPRASAGDC